ncbi:signal peptide peptidase SppA [Rummeliibacillus stabekisii]|uniref:signal peptide peptidase SppA n=1 Tax=Rummeliibacillus stabekisii TaxID=241244 RepID=UPI00116B3E40|nr:signal peptide peptidase SppA [Rummeliibacillus stabekisii]MBB5168720.1 protease-4 [Rummeliibacillus stabekisii]GEL05141.1 peptidase [Rummeliibacillus stabekisii]
MTVKRWVALGIAIVLFAMSAFVSIALSFAKMDFKKGLESIADLDSTYDYNVLKNGNPSKQIAVLTVNGTIQDTGESTSIFSSETYNHQYFMDQLEDIRKNKSVKGVLLKVNSPGGGTNESKQIYDKIKEIKKERNIPIYVSMGSMAASGGYYISAPADVIYADEETLTGSIGVIMQGMDYSKLAKKLGIEFNTIKTGPYKDIMNGSREMTPAEKKLLQNMVNDSYGRFVKVVADGRGMSEKEVRSIADGRIMNGSQAVKAGLVDRLGYSEDALKALMKDNKLQGAEVFEYSTDEGWGSIFSAKLSSKLMPSAEKEAISKMLSTSSAPRMMYLYGEE